MKFFWRIHLTLTRLILSFLDMVVTFSQKESHTINAVSARRPLLRRSLQQAWDLYAMWISFDPVKHHRAMLVQVLLAVLSTCLTWGWTPEAAIFAMSFGMLLRMGELVR